VLSFLKTVVSEAVPVYDIWCKGEKVFFFQKELLLIPGLA
jgi:hypothetical protein